MSGLQDEPTARPRKVTRRRLLVRLVAMVLTLVVVDLAVGGYLHGKRAYDDAYRLPRERSMAELPGLVHHIEGLRGDAPVVTFLGASPTWGDTNSSGGHTYVAAFERDARAGGVDARAFNLGANGELVADQYFLAQRLAPSSDLLVVQLTYHTFAAKARDAAQRYPELPGMLDVPVTAELAGVLGLDTTTRPDVNGVVDRTLTRAWRLYREREALSDRVAGRSLEEELFMRWDVWADKRPDGPPEIEHPARALPFDRLDPMEQTTLVERWAENGDYRIKRSDSELRTLELLCAALEEHGAQAVFFMSPLNVRTLQAWELLDRARYNANVAVIGAVVERHGFTFIDFNQPGLLLPGGAFADMNHTTDAGSEVFGARLYAKLAPLLHTLAPEASR